MLPVHSISTTIARSARTIALRGAPMRCHRQIVACFASWNRCDRLDSILPQLRARFDEVKDDDDDCVYVMPKKTHESVWAEVDRLRQEQEQQEEAIASASRQAAILVPLITCNGVPSLVYTTRSSNLHSHASEVSFPGGHFEDDVDVTLEDTALRETSEELLSAYPFEDMEILGRASAVPSIRGAPVTPIVAVMPYEIEDASTTFPGNPDEVKEVFCVGLEELLEIETSEYSPRFGCSIPVFPTKDGQRIWGLTAIVTRPLLHRLFKPVFGL